MLEFIQLMGLKRILFLAGLILYVVVILIILCLPEKKRTCHKQDELTNTYNEPDKDELCVPKDADYCVSDKSPRTFANLFRKKSRSMDPWEF